eukprot:170504_1
MSHCELSGKCVESICEYWMMIALEQCTFKKQFNKMKKIIKTMIGEYCNQSMVFVAVPSSIVVTNHRRPITVYEIVISSPLLPAQYIVYKRYRDFYAFHHKLEFCIVNDPELKEQVFDVPQMPCRQLIHSMQRDFIRKRQHDLQIYLRHVLKYEHLRCNELMMDFLSFPQVLRKSLISKLNWKYQIIVYRYITTEQAANSVIIPLDILPVIASFYSQWTFFS